jgi:hypothetical protein
VASVQSSTGSRGVLIRGSNAGYTMFRGSVKGTGYPLYSPVSPSFLHPCVTVCHHVSTGLYLEWLSVRDINQSACRSAVFSTSQPRTALIGRHCFDSLVQGHPSFIAYRWSGSTLARDQKIHLRYQTILPWGMVLSQVKENFCTSRSPRSFFFFFLRAALETKFGNIFIFIQYFTFSDHCTLNTTLLWKVSIWGSSARAVLPIRHITCPSSRRKDKALKIDHICLSMCQQISVSE